MTEESEAWIDAMNESYQKGYQRGFNAGRKQGMKDAAAIVDFDHGWLPGKRLATIILAAMEKLP